jgi:ubiquitin C-terminal hydrolase
MKPLDKFGNHQLETCNLKGFVNIGNTCYMDSILFLLLAIPSRFITNSLLGGIKNNKILPTLFNERRLIKTPNPRTILVKIPLERIIKLKEKFQTQLALFQESIRDETDTRIDVYELKKILKRMGKKLFCDYSQQDSEEFYNFINSLFNLESFFSLEQGFRKERGDKNWVQTKVNVNKSSTFYISNDAIKYIQRQKNQRFKEKKQLDPTVKKLKIKLSDFLPLTTKDKVVTSPPKSDFYIKNKTIILNVVNQNNFILFQLNRIDPFIGRKISEQIYPNEKLEISNGSEIINSSDPELINALKTTGLKLNSTKKELFLTGIVVHKNFSGGIDAGHYITYFLCQLNNFWYLYDDTLPFPHISLVGTYKDLLKHNETKSQSLFLLYQSEEDRKILTPRKITKSYKRRRQRSKRKGSRRRNSRSKRQMSRRQRARRRKSK